MPGRRERRSRVARRLNPTRHNEFFKRADGVGLQPGGVLADHASSGRCHYTEMSALSARYGRAPVHIVVGVAPGGLRFVQRLRPRNPHRVICGSPQSVERLLPRNIEGHAGGLRGGKRHAHIVGWRCVDRGRGHGLLPAGMPTWPQHGPSCRETAPERPARGRQKAQRPSQPGSGKVKCRSGRDRRSGRQDRKISGWPEPAPRSSGPQPALGAGRHAGHQGRARLPRPQPQHLCR